MIKTMEKPKAPDLPTSIGSFRRMGSGECNTETAQSGDRIFTKYDFLDRMQDETFTTNLRNAQRQWKRDGTSLRRVYDRT